MVGPASRSEFPPGMARVEPETLRVAIVDDERLARDKLRRFLEGVDGVELVGESDGGESALEMIRRKAPDVVFLDIQMPGVNGFEVARRISGSAMPHIVFVTAHDQFAVEAFEIEAIDYVLKPFDRSRLEKALDRVRRRTREQLHERIDSLLSRINASREEHDTPRVEPLERFVVRTGGRMILIDPDQVHWIQAEGNYARLHTDDRRPLIRAALSTLEKQLESRGFRRIHRATLVNFAKVKEIQRGVGDDYIVILENGTQLAMSRRYRARLRGLLG